MARAPAGRRSPAGARWTVSTQSLTGRLRWIATEPAFTPYYALNASDRARLVYMAEFDLEGGEELPTGVPAQVLLNDD